MTDRNEEARNRIIEHANRNAEFCKGDDGYTYYWPTGTGGCFSANTLRTIADELDRRNKEWDDQIKNDPIFGATNET